ncbi:MAG: hypothetical protein CSYNP_02815 [Syntrophus sp. SKADARSKE-3]|nr:hypothetical protein [Syntrophus sp. SKADARSKE-3]
MNFYREVSHTRFSLALILIAGLIVVSLFLNGIVTSSDGYSSPLPSFGKGTKELRVYTDYFCRPCRSVEPELDKAIRTFASDSEYRVVFIDVPMHAETVMYARHYLTAVRANQQLLSALNARKLLFAAANDQIKIDTEIEKRFMQAGIKQIKYDVKDSFLAMQGMFRKDRIKMTPTIVIEDKQGAKKFEGSWAVREAIKSLTKK